MFCATFHPYCSREQWAIVLETRALLFSNNGPLFKQSTLLFSTVLTISLFSRIVLSKCYCSLGSRVFYYIVDIVLTPFFFSSL